MPTASTIAPTGEQLLVQRLHDATSRNAAFEELVRVYQRMLYYHVRRMTGSHDDADDVLQNTFVKAWRNIGNFRGDSSLKTWLYRIATNEAITHINSRKKRTAEDIDTLISAESTAVSRQETPIDGDAVEKKLQAAIAALPDKQRAVFALRYYDEMPYEEMSGVLETSVGALKASYHHAAKKIESFLLSHMER